MARLGRGRTAASEVLKDFRLILGSVRRHYASIAQTGGVSGAQVWALATIARRPGMRVSDLAVALSVHQSTASNLVEKLIRNGLAARRRDSLDQRVVRLALTARGRRVIRRAPRPAGDALTAALGRLPSEVLARLRSDLAALVRALRTSAP